MMQTPTANQYGSRSLTVVVKAVRHWTNRWTVERNRLRTSRKIAGLPAIVQRDITELDRLDDQSK